MSIFISYRRDDTVWAAQSLYEGLCGKFGKRNIFLDQRNIGGGDKFESLIEDQISKSRVMVSIIGPEWTSRLVSSGVSRSAEKSFWGLFKRRSDHPRFTPQKRDYVAVEILAALKHDVPIVPVLIEDTPLPDASKLPSEFRPVLNHNAIRVWSAGLDQHIVEVAKAIRKHRKPWYEKHLHRATRWINPFWSLEWSSYRTASIVASLALTIGLAIFSYQSHSDAEDLRQQLRAEQQKAEGAAAGAATTAAIATGCLLLGPVMWLKCAVVAAAAGAATGTAVSSTNK
ncbi:MAG: toll/interleukin-1 receptor domain-containing protein [Pseudomonadota bacterium]